MSKTLFDYSEPIRIAEGTYWVGFADEKTGLHCNPYLIVDRGEAVLIDSGSRNAFSTVMLKIMRTGTNPNMIRRLIYQHYDPDLCGSIPHIEAIIEGNDLEIISHDENNIFIHHYGVKSPLTCIEKMGLHFDFRSGRRLEFIRTPYAHSPGSFMTYDTKTKVLYSSDIFGSYDSNWSLYTQMDEHCEECDATRACPHTGNQCPLYGIMDFHRRIMTSEKALKYALSRIERLDIALIAPQHGSLLDTQFARDVVIQKLKTLDSVGIEYYLGGRSVEAEEDRGVYPQASEP